MNSCFDRRSKLRDGCMQPCQVREHKKDQKLTTAGAKTMCTRECNEKEKQDPMLKACAAANLQ